MYRYAQIDENGYVVSDSYLSGEVIKDNMIAVDEDFDLTNKRYVNGAWEAYTPEVIATDSVATDRELLETIVANQEQQELDNAATYVEVAYSNCLTELNE